MSNPNAAPKVINNGLNDLSIRTPVPVAEDRPTHLPISFIYAKKGDPSEPQLCVGGSRELLFHADSFDPTSRRLTNERCNSFVSRWPSALARSASIIKSAIHPRPLRESCLTV